MTSLLVGMLSPARSVGDKTGRSMCSVCGADASLRCSGCSASSTADDDATANALVFCSKGHQKIVWPEHKAVCGGKARPFCLPDLTRHDLELFVRYWDKPAFSERQHEHLGHLMEGLFKLPAGAVNETAHSLNGRIKSCGTIDGFAAPIVAAQILSGSLFAQHPCISQLEKTEFPVACELDLSATCFISIVLFHLKGFRIELPPNAHDRFMHRLVIWWGLLRAMYRQQQTKQFTPVEVTVEHLDNAMQLLSLEVLPFMPQPLIWSSFFHYITDPMWLIPKMRTYKSGAAPYGDGMSKIWRILPIEEVHLGENVARMDWTPL